MPNLYVAVSSMAKLRMAEHAAKIYGQMEKQGWRKSLDSMGCCQYHGPHDARCPVGALIDNDIYMIDMEGNPVMALLDNFPKVRTKLLAGMKFEEQIAVSLFLEDFQSAHDGPEDEDDDYWMRSRFNDVLDKWGVVLHATT